MSIVRKDSLQALEGVSGEAMKSLHRLTPSAKARKFRLLLPIIEAKIGEGVRHMDIIRALSSEGLELSENTYFTYLRRARNKKPMAAPQGAPPASRPVVATMPVVAADLPTSSSQSTERAGRRPPTFDYDPHGIPDLLK